MTTSDTTRTRHLVALATQLERFERRGRFDAAAYQDVVAKLSEELAHGHPSAVLETVLGTFPATAELYENLHYEHSGLCRSDLDRAMKSELQAREAIAAATRGAKA
jgi:hypothetical protein